MAFTHVSVYYLKFHHWKETQSESSVEENIFEKDSAHLVKKYLFCIPTMGQPQRLPYTVFMKF